MCRGANITASIDRWCLHLSALNPRFILVSVSDKISRYFFSFNLSITFTVFTLCIGSKRLQDNVLKGHVSRTGIFENLPAKSCLTKTQMDRSICKKKKKKQLRYLSITGFNGFNKDGFLWVHLRGTLVFRAGFWNTSSWLLPVIVMQLLFNEMIIILSVFKNMFLCCIKVEIQSLSPRLE